jgi:low affinity Fe/Cu permease
MKKNTEKNFEKFSAAVSKATGKPNAFNIAFIIVPAWAVSGPIYNFSDTWQLVINTGTTIITFLMAFVIQESQNKDTMALQLKLNELIAALEKAGQIYFRENTGGKINTHIHF